MEESWDECIEGSFLLLAEKAASSESSEDAVRFAQAAALLSGIIPTLKNM